MSLTLLDRDEFREIMRKHIYNVIEEILKSGEEFAIAVEVEHITFDPPLPQEIVSSFGEIALFGLTGYTYTTITMDRDSIRFEAGFGVENIGSFVTVPLLAIRDVIIDDIVVAVNMAKYREKVDDIEIEKSMNAFLSNPENEKLLKKSRK